MRHVLKVVGSVAYGAGADILHDAYVSVLGL